MIATHISPLAVFPTVWMALEKWPGIPLILACGRDLVASMLWSSAVPRFVVTHATVADAVAASGSPPPTMPGGPRVDRRGQRGPTHPGVACRHSTPVELDDADDAVLVASELVENMRRRRLGRCTSSADGVRSRSPGERLARTLISAVAEPRRRMCRSIRAAPGRYGGERSRRTRARRTRPAALCAG
jgi:hypothetical protein